MYCMYDDVCICVVLNCANLSVTGNEAISEDLSNLVKIIKDSITHSSNLICSSSSSSSSSSKVSSSGSSSSSSSVGNKQTRNFLQNSSHSSKMNNHAKDFSQYLDIALSGDDYLFLLYIQL